MNKYLLFLAIPLMLLTACASQQYSKVTKQDFPDSQNKLDDRVVDKDQYNFAGLGAVGNGVQGERISGLEYERRFSI